MTKKMQEHGKLYEGTPADSMPTYVRAILRVVAGTTFLVSVDGEPLPKRFHLQPNNLSPGGYEIVEVLAAGGNSPLDNPHLYARRRPIADEELAINILEDATGMETARRHYAAFARDVVGGLPLDSSWTLPEDRIQQWLTAQSQD